MKVTSMKKIQGKAFKLNPVAAVMLVAMAAQFPANVARANAGFGPNTDVTGKQIAVPTFYANSPQGLQVALDAKHQPVLNLLGNPATVADILAGNVPGGTAYGTLAAALAAGALVDTGMPLRKFVDPLAGAYNGLDGAPGATGLQSGIPVAITEKWFNPITQKPTQDDYYEIAIVEYTERMHSDLAKETRLRGYVQIETTGLAGLTDKAGVGSEHIPATYPDGAPIVDTQGNQVYFVHKPHYLGPIILAAKGTPVRIKATNYLPYTDANGKHVGSPFGGEAFIPVDELIAGGGPVTKADGTAALDQNGHPIMMSQNRASIHWHGGDTPWISDGTPHQWFTPAGDISYTVGDALHPVKDAAHPNGVGMGKGDSAQDVPDMPPSGDGSYTLYFPNNLSGRLMMYHDHTSGLTKVNVYEGMAAGYVVYDPTELAMVAKAINSNPATTTGLLDTVGIPLVIQDKTFVPKNMGAGPVQSQDAKWDLNHWGKEGDFFFPHVYETNQDPNSIDGTNPVGRWDWGPWFWPVFPAQLSLPSGDYGHATATPEAFMDTPIVNGQAYPTMTVEPKTYRFRILSVANDRSQNLGLYQAVDANGVLCDAKNPNPAVAPIAPGGVGTPAACTEIKMVPAQPTAGFPATWPTDGRAGGVPDPATAGPDIVQIGNEGGLLPAPAIWKAQPVTFEQNVRSITVFNVLNHQLLLGAAERADVLIDFSKYAGQTLIVYNDAPAPMPGYDPRIDYYTGVGDQTAAGGAYDTLPGYGPNTRTVMQIKVNNTTPAPALNTTALLTDLPKAYATTQPAPIIPAVAYNAPFGTTRTNNNYASIGTGSSSVGAPGSSNAVAGYFSYTDSNGRSQKIKVINKAIQELFDPVYGRMNATLAVELPFSSATVATTIPLAYIDTPVDALDGINDWVSAKDTQIWKITHNGVDSHPVHFHLVNVQVINRVSWDGTIKPPEANEVGWKETLRMNPLEDVYVAVKAVRPSVPFGVPASHRLLDPAQTVDSQIGFTQIDPTTGAAPTSQVTLAGALNVTFYSNQITNFDNEYVWHCHILGHEENDFMRPFIFHPTVTTPDAPATVTVSGSTVSWIDTTPVGGQDAQGIPTAGTNKAYPVPTSSPKNEIGYKVVQDVVTQVATSLAKTGYTSTSGSAVTNLRGGTGYTTAPAVTVNGTLVSGTPLTATATVAAGVVTGITLSGGPALYSAAPSLTIARPATGTRANATLASTATPYLAAPTLASTTATTLLGTAAANATSWTSANALPTSGVVSGPATVADAKGNTVTTTVTANPVAVIAWNAAGDSARGTSATTTAATTTVAAAVYVAPKSTVAAAQAAAAGPTGLTQTLVNGGTSTVLTWTTPTVPRGYSITGYRIVVTETTGAGIQQAPVTTTVAAALRSFTFALPAGSTFAATVTALTANGALTGTVTVFPNTTTTAQGSVALSWIAVPGATGYAVNGTTVAASCVLDALTGLTTCTATVAATAGALTTYVVTAQTLAGTTAGSTTKVLDKTAYAPVLFAAKAGAVARTVVLTWANDVRNVNNVTGITLTWNGVSQTLVPTSTGATLVGLTTGTSYVFSIVANSALGVSPALPTITVVAP